MRKKNFLIKRMTFATEKYLIVTTIINQKKIFLTYYKHFYKQKLHYLK